MGEYDRLDHLKRTLESHRPLAPALAARLRENMLLEWTYHSNAIEGNTLTLRETQVALEGMTVGGKSLREHLEAINHKEAIEHVEVLVAEAAPLSERIIREIHQLILRKIDDAHAGIYRKNNVTIAGAEHVPPDALHVQDEMQQFIHWYENDAMALHAVERAARIHSEFVKIHPFIDGNGRTSRLLMNMELMKNGFPPAILPVGRRLEYYNALDSAHTRHDYTAFLRLISDLVEESFNPYWHALRLDQCTPSPRC